MTPRERRSIAAVSTAAFAIMLLAVAATRRTDPPIHVFRVTLGLHDRQPTDWAHPLGSFPRILDKLWLSSFIKYR